MRETIIFTASKGHVELVDNIDAAEDDKKCITEDNWVTSECPSLPHIGVDNEGSQYKHGREDQ